jgi:hypothetical protein
MTPLPLLPFGTCRAASDGNSEKDFAADANSEKDIIAGITDDETTDESQG